jgi:uncharacterized protein YdeI (YjbR/CyaY-like superfamily)
MKIGKTIYFDNRYDWRDWLENNFKDADEIWLIFPKKHTGKPSILYNDAVEEALCFGWIDSIRKRLDEDHSVQRFTPRNKKSHWSQANKERCRWLLKNNKVHPSLVDSYQSIVNEKFKFPKDILDKIKENKKAWKNYRYFSDAYKRIRIAYIEAARNRPEEFEKRLKNFIAKTEENRMIGYGGIKKYY